MRIYIYKERGSFEVRNMDAPGMSKIGRGKTIKKALGDFFIAYQTELGITYIGLDDESQKAETKRRQKELAKR